MFLPICFSGKSVYWDLSLMQPNVLLYYTSSFKWLFFLNSSSTVGFLKLLRMWAQRFLHTGHTSYAPWAALIGNGTPGLSAFWERQVWVVFIARTGCPVSPCGVLYVLLQDLTWDPSSIHSSAGPAWSGSVWSHQLTLLSLSPAWVGNSSTHAWACTQGNLHFNIFLSQFA